VLKKQKHNKHDTFIPALMDEIEAAIIQIEKNHKVLQKSLTGIPKQI
jgi:hypothetical protein